LAKKRSKTVKKMIGGRNNDLGHLGGTSKEGAPTVMTPDLRRGTTGQVSINPLRDIEIGGTGVAQGLHLVTTTRDRMTAATIDTILTTDVMTVIPVMTTDVVDSINN
jgi:hypothetical protein